MGRVPTSLQVVLICLALFHLVQSCAAVSSWPERRIRASRILSELDHEVRQTNKEEEFLEEGEARRMSIQMNDYAPSGPNDRHTPKPPE